MYDRSVLAVLTPCDEENLARMAFRLNHNAARFHGATSSIGIAQEPIIDSREPTPAPPSPSELDRSAADYILLALGDQGLEDAPNTWRFGTNKKLCHVLLGYRGTAGISAFQYSITVDDDFCIWLHDFQSSHGTAVGYNGQGQDEIRKKDTWILSYGPGRTQHWEDIRIYSVALLSRLSSPTTRQRILSISSTSELPQSEARPHCCP